MDAVDLCGALEGTSLSRLVVAVAEFADDNLTLLEVRHQPSKHAVDAAPVLSVYTWVWHQFTLTKTMEMDSQ